MAKIVITGAAGFIGSQLAPRLIMMGHDVHLVDNLSHGYVENLTHAGKVIGSFHEMDIRHANLAHVLEGADAVYHLAAISALPSCQQNPQEATAVNVGGTVNVLEQARLAGVRRVIFASTSALYEKNTHFPCREDDEVAPTLTYPVTKLQAEAICKGYAATYGMEIVTTRYYNVYGPQQDLKRKSPAFVGYVIRELLAGRAPILHSNGEQRRDYVHVDDINAINILLLTHPAAPGQTYNIASGKAWSVNEMYAMIARAAGSTLKPEFRPAKRFWDAYPELFQGRYPISEQKLVEEVEKFTLGTSFKAESELGWTPQVTLEDGLKRTVEAIRQRLAEG